MKKVLGMVVVCLFLFTALIANAQIAPAIIENFTDVAVTLRGIDSNDLIGAVDPLQVRADIGARSVILSIPLALYDTVITAICSLQACIMDITVDYDHMGVTSIDVTRLVVGQDPT